MTVCKQGIVIISRKRVLIALAVGAIFVAGLIIDPAALLQLLWFCATGNCGVPAYWLAAAAAGGLGIWTVVALVRRRRRPVRGRARQKPKPPAKSGRTGRRKTPARA